jgi:hypothetical protein
LVEIALAISEEAWQVFRQTNRWPDTRQKSDPYSVAGNTKRNGHFITLFKRKRKGFQDSDTIPVYFYIFSKTDWGPTEPDNPYGLENAWFHCLLTWPLTLAIIVGRVNIRILKISAYAEILYVITKLSHKWRMPPKRFLMHAGIMKGKVSESTN